MRRKRTIYFEDARHYYLYNPDPPMTMDQALMPVEQVAGTGVDTFIYGIACGGLFYPSKIGRQFGELMRPFKAEYSAAFWRAWTNMQALIKQGHDPMRLLIDHAHKRGMEFIASFRMGTFDSLTGRTDSQQVSKGGRGFAHPEVREYVFNILQEVSTQYPTDGVEMDFAAAPAALDWFFKPEETAENIPLMTDHVRQISEMVRRRKVNPGIIGARIFPTEAINMQRGLDVRTWLKEGLVDYVTPVFYVTLTHDPDMPIEWAIEAAHRYDASVYGFLQPDFRNEERRFYTREYASQEMLRAAAANFIDKGVDGLYTWFLPWPFSTAERGFLCELGDFDRLRKGNKHYYLRRRDKSADEVGYTAVLPVQVPYAQLGKLHDIPFYVSDNIEAEAKNIHKIVLRMNIFDTVTDDNLTILLNGKSLASELCYRSPSTALEPYYGQWLEFNLKDVLPCKGKNLLQIAMNSRPPELEADIRVEDVEMIIEYGFYPRGLTPGG